MPALLPKCSAMYEVGCYYIDGDHMDKLLVDSPDGLIRCNHNMNRADCCQPDVYGLNSGNKSIEIKAPYPDGNNMPVHYSIPRRYRSGTLNSNTVNSKFCLIRSFFEIFARFLSFHV